MEHLPASPRPSICAQVPTQEQVVSVTKELQARSQLPPQVAKVLAAMPKDTHPMTQLSQAVLALQVGEGPQVCTGLQLVQHWQARSSMPGLQHIS